MFRERRIALVCDGKKDLGTSILMTKIFYFDFFLIIFEDQAIRNPDLRAVVNVKFFNLHFQQYSAGKIINTFDN